MLHPHTRLQLVDEKIGYGVFATDFIPAGTITYVRDSLDIELHASHDLVTSPAYEAYVKKYAYREANGNHIIGWDLSKYMNHSCDANTLSTGYGFEIAIRDIYSGEQVTDDYGMLNIESPMPCSCQHEHCRWDIKPDDMEHLWQPWDEIVIMALKNMLSVTQPLMELLDSETCRSVMHYLNTGHNYQSVRLLQFVVSGEQEEVAS